MSSLIGKVYYYDSYRESLWNCTWFRKHKPVLPLEMDIRGNMYQLCKRCGSEVYLEGNGWN